MRQRGVPGVAMLMAAVMFLPGGASAQRSVGPHPEVRLEAIVATHSTPQVGVGFNAAAGTYLRWGIVLGAGASARNGRNVATARIDGVVRFLLDPFKEARRAPYGLAGVSLMDDGSHSWQPRVLVGIGLEGRTRGRVIPSVELALGGGVRFAVVMRRAKANRR